MKKIISIVFITIISICSILSYANATQGNSMEVSLRSNGKSGNDIYIDVYIEEIKGFSGINTFIAKKVYDNEVLKYIETTTQNDNWEIVGDDGNIVLRKMNGEDFEKGKLCTLKFKVLKNEETTIKLEEIDACNNEKDVYWEDGNVNSPLIKINMNNISQSNKTHKSYIGIILITLGILGLAGVGIHYFINKNNN